jgi:opacity protein-like surface antigen
MTRHLPLLLSAAAVCASGCAAVSDVVATGAGTYMVSSHGVMGYSSGGAERAKAFAAADTFCKQQGKQVQSLSSSDTPSGFGRIASGDVEFGCL